MSVHSELTIGHLRYHVARTSHLTTCPRNLSSETSYCKAITIWCDAGFNLTKWTKWSGDYRNSKRAEPPTSSLKIKNPYPLAVDSKIVDGEWKSGQPIHARRCLHDDAVGNLEKVKVTPAVYQHLFHFTTLAFKILRHSRPSQRTRAPMTVQIQKQHPKRIISVAHWSITAAKRCATSSGTVGTLQQLLLHQLLYNQKHATRLSVTTSPTGTHLIRRGSSKLYSKLSLRGVRPSVVRKVSHSCFRWLRTILHDVETALICRIACRGFLYMDRIVVKPRLLSIICSLVRSWFPAPRSIHCTVSSSSLRQGIVPSPAGLYLVINHATRRTKLERDPFPVVRYSRQCSWLMLLNGGTKVASVDTFASIQVHVVATCSALAHPQLIGSTHVFTVPHPHVRRSHCVSMRPTFEPLQYPVSDRHISRLDWPATTLATVSNKQKTHEEPLISKRCDSHPIHHHFECCSCSPDMLLETWFGVQVQYRVLLRTS